jgi:hypothetical protein
MANQPNQDRAVENSVPANPSGRSGTSGPETPSHKRGTDAIPTGTPTSDRHAAETAHQWEPEEKGIDAAKDLNSDAAGARTRSSSRP